MKKTASRMITSFLTVACVVSLTGRICQGSEISATSTEVSEVPAFEVKAASLPNIYAVNLNAFESRGFSTETALINLDNYPNTEISAMLTTSIEPDSSVSLNGEKPQNIEEVAVPDSVRLNVPLFDQRELGLDTGCEIVSLGMMINYEASADVYDLVGQTPRSSDPNLGFRGDPYSSGGFTVFPSALLEITENYLDNAIDMSGGSIEDVTKQLQNGYPVVAWVNGLGWNVHAITISGYDENGLYYNDPWMGEKDSFITYDGFYEIWNKPIHDTRYNISYSPRKALSYVQEEQQSAMQI